MTVPEKRAHFRQYFQIELLVLNGRVALKQQYGVYFFVVKVTRCGVLAVSVQSFLSTISKLNFEKTLIEVSLPVVISSP